MSSPSTRTTNPGLTAQAATSPTISSRPSSPFNSTLARKRISRRCAFSGHFIFGLRLRLVLPVDRPRLLDPRTFDRGLSPAATRFYGHAECSTGFSGCRPPTHPDVNGPHLNSMSGRRSFKSGQRFSPLLQARRHLAQPWGNAPARHRTGWHLGKITHEPHRGT